MTDSVLYCTTSIPTESYRGICKFLLFYMSGSSKNLNSIQMRKLDMRFNVDVAFSFFFPPHPS